MPELQRLLAAYRRQFQVASVMWAVVMACAAGGLLVVLGEVSGASTDVTRTIPPTMALFCGGAVAWLWCRQWTPARVAGEVESRIGGLDNLVITAEEFSSGQRNAPHPLLLSELVSQAVERLQRSRPADIRPLLLPIACAVGAVVGLLAVLVAVPMQSAAPSQRGGSSEPHVLPGLASGDLHVVITAPAYAQRPVLNVLNPTAVTALEGSRVRIETASQATAVRLVEVDLRVTPFAVTDGRFVHELTASHSRALVIQYGERSSSADRLIQLRVEPDLRPAVRIMQPATDLVFGEPVGRLPVEIEARDDLGLRSLVLRYTRVAGSGESFTFQEGELPLQVARGAAAWTARGVFALDALGLEDGDTLVYRAVATDHKPGADPSTSDTFLVEVGRLAGVASTGFALPDDRDRQAISQQMLIIKTERLHNERGKMAAEAFAEQARMLAIEQRMVKAEFVFMTGGEVADEIEEATHAHELAEGRLENAGQVELLAAIREMSRAEARLNDADTVRGLEFERTALKALQRAFDRRRYLLRTLPERTRIDPTRRLAGELDAAKSSTQQPTPAPLDPVLVRARDVLRVLSAFAGAEPEGSSLVASRVMAVDPSADALQRVALVIAAAQTDDARRSATLAAQQVLIELMKVRLSRGATGRVPQQPLLGRLADELSRRSGAGR